MAVKKLKSQRGETLLEVLASMVVLTIGMIILAGAIISAGLTNQKVDNAGKQELSVSSETADIKIKVQLGENTFSFDNYVLKESGGQDGVGKVYYYELKTAEEEP